MVVGAIGTAAKESAGKEVVVIRQMKEQVVLYTIHRGSYDQIGPSVGGLFALAGQKGLMPPRGPVTYAYLNNPTLVSSEHWLTEIRIPVDEKALKAAGTLGEMTDVKKLPAMEVAVAVKPEGQADPAGIYQRLFAWMQEHNYVNVDGFSEVFLTNAMSGDCARMRSEIMVPVKQLAVKAAD